MLLLLLALLPLLAEALPIPVMPSSSAAQSSSSSGPRKDSSFVLPGAPPLAFKQYADYIQWADPLTGTFRPPLRSFCSFRSFHSLCVR